MESLRIVLVGSLLAEFSPAFLILALHALPPNLQEVWEEVKTLYTAGDRVRPKSGAGSGSVISLITVSDEAKPETVWYRTECGSVPTMRPPFIRFDPR